MARIVFGTTPILSHLTVIAKEKNLFRKNNIDIDFRNFFVGKKCMHALEKGWADMANVIDANVAVLASQRKVKTKLVACSQIRTDGTILARRDQGISSPQSLVGKKVGYMKETSSHVFLLYFCRHHRLNIEDFELVDIQTDQMERALLLGEIDACSIWQPFTTRTKIAAARSDIDLISFKNEGFFKLYVAIAAHQKSLDKKQEEIQAVLHTLKEAEHFMAENPDETDTILAGSLGMSLPFYKEISEDIDDKITGFEDGFRKSVSTYAKWIDATQQINYEKFIDNALR